MNDLGKGYFVGCFLGATVVGLIWWLLYEPEPPPTCEEVRLEEWSHLQCFKNRPQCKIAGWQTYERYRQVQRAVRACDRADALQSEINDDTEVMSNE